MFVTASTIATAAQAYSDAHRLKVVVDTTGSPTIASWSADAANTSRTATTRVRAPFPSPSQLLAFPSSIHTWSSSFQALYTRARCVSLSIFPSSSSSSYLTHSFF
jgi:hypothetical protein